MDGKSHNLLTIQEAAERLRISVPTLYGWAFKRKIEFVKIGGRLRFHEREIQRIIADGTRHRF